MAVIMALAVILWGALTGAGYSLQPILTVSVLVMIVGLAITASTRPKRATA